MKGAEDWLSKLQAHVDAKTVELEGRDKCLQELQMVRRGDTGPYPSTDCVNGRA